MDRLNRFLDKPPLIIPLLLLAATAFCCTFPLFANQTLPFLHDIVFHIFQADQFSKALNDGILYPRWISDANNGYGSPTFIYYAPLSYYFVSVINFLIPSLITSMIIAIWFSFFLSGLTMLMASRGIFGRPGSLLSAILYQVLPFHIFDLYMRGTFAELFAFIWFPLIILCVHKIFYSRDNKSAFAGLSVSYAGLILTHLVSGFIFSFVIGTYLLFNYFILKDKKTFLIALSAFLLGLCLSSFYLIPVIFERNFVQIDYIVNCPYCDYKMNFLFIWDEIQAKGQHFYIPLHIIVVLELFLFILCVLLIYKNRERSLDKSKQYFFVFLFFSAFFLTTPLSKPIWEIIPGFSSLQFPWRWVAMMELSLCFLIGGVFSSEKRFGYKKEMIMRAIVYLMITISILSFVAVFKSEPFSEKFMKKIADPEQFQLIMDPIIEYTPVWATSLEEIIAEEERDRVSVISGAAKTEIIEWRPEQRTINVKAFAPSLLRIATFYYPGWGAEVEGKETEINIEKNSGAMLISVPEGEHIIDLRFADTPLRYYAKAVSMAFLMILVLFILFQRKKVK